MEEILLFEEGNKFDAFLSNRERGLRIPLAQITEMNNLLYSGTYRGKLLMDHERTYMLREALTTSSFPFLFGDVLQRQMLANYKATPPVWKAFSKLSTVPRIAPQVGGYRFAMAGGDQFLPLVGQKGEYLASERTEIRYSITVDKRGRQFDISWEAMINDDLGALKDTPARFASAAEKTEHRVTTALYVHNVVLATNARGNLSANPLTIANLETALEAMASFTDAAGEPIMNRAKFLVVPPALDLTARAILTSANKMGLAGATTIAGAPDVWVPTTNVVANYGLTLIVDPYLTTLDIAAGNPLSAVGGWYLFADPKDIAVLEMAHLSGHESPEIVMKASDKVTIGGGAVNALSGDFATDNIFYRVRIIFGGTTLDWRGFYFGGHLD